MLYLKPLTPTGLSEAQKLVTEHHYLHRPVDLRTMPEGFAIHLDHVGFVGVLFFGRPEATRCYPWYGSIDDVQTGRAEVTRWQVLNLSRVWLSPVVQPGGTKHHFQWLPGFWDRHDVWHSTLASTVLRMAIARVGVYYLERRPPCFLEEPYEIRWLLSYCDTRLHKGTIYAASGFELYRTNARGIQTWRIPLPRLTPGADAHIRALAEINPRSIRFRARRSQLSFDLN